jgi:hypothetical protein
MASGRPCKGLCWLAYLILVVTSLLGLSPREADGHRLLNLPQRVRYACGKRIFQVYTSAPEGRLDAVSGSVSTASVQAYAEGVTSPVRRGRLRLRPRLVTRIRGAQTRSAAAAPEKAAIYEFDVLYGDLPLANASRTVVVQHGKALAIRDRNIPKVDQLPASRAEVSLDAASALAVNDARTILSHVYPGATTRLALDPHSETPPHLEIWPDPSGKSAHLAWSFNVRSTDRRYPLLRRYWVAAQGQPRILDFVDLIFYPHDSCTARPQPARTQPLQLPNRELPDLDNSWEKWALSAGPSRGTPARPYIPGNARVSPRAVVTPTPSATTDLTHGPVTGFVTGIVWENSPYGRTMYRSLPYVEVGARGIGGSQTVRADREGRFEAGALKGPVTLHVRLSGPACRVHNDHVSKTDAAVTHFMRLGHAPAHLEFTGGVMNEFNLSQTSAYYYVTQAFEFVRGFIPDHPSRLAGLSTHVNVDNTCNAYYDTTEHSLNFFRGAGSKCPNSAYRDVIFHEYGHAVDDELGGVLDTAYSEGFGDSLAILLTHGSVVGRDFYGSGQNLRDASRLLYWPQVKDGEVHEAGLAYAGFTWELTRLLARSYGSEAQAFDVARHLILGAAAKNPKDIPDAVRLSFYLDALLYPNPRGGESLHFRHLQAAARSRYIPCPQQAPAVAALLLK